MTRDSRQQRSADRNQAQQRTSTGPVAGQATPLQQLQGMVGNRAMGALLRQAGVQAKLAVNQPGDAYEQEADRLSAPAPAGLATASGPVSAPAGRSPAPGPAPAGHLRTQAPVVLRRAPAGGAGAVHPALEQALNAGRGSGSPLPDSVRTSMEGRLGADFSQVRLHTDGSAGELAQGLGAHAFTYGQDVYFDKGRYDPQTASGQQLLAHELVHVVQQTGTSGRESSGSAIQRHEAPWHQGEERYGLTFGPDGQRHQNGLTLEETSAVYFGNWMRDLNQAFVPLATSVVSPTILFHLLNYMAVTKFGREITPEQFGYYIPAEHIDSPAGLTTSGDLLPGQPEITGFTKQGGALPQPGKVAPPTRPAAFDTPQERVEPDSPVPNAGTDQVTVFDVDQAGVMAYLRRTNLHMERRLDLAAQAGRNPEGFMHFGAALHAVEDLFAHSNWIEIGLNKLLQEDPTLLPDLDPSQRKLFTYATEVDVPKGESTERRPVLMTGSFTGVDTQVSVSSELVGFCEEGLPEPKTDAQLAAEEKFVAAIINDSQSEVNNNPELKKLILDNMGPGVVQGGADLALQNLPLAKIYTLMPNLVPEKPRMAVSKATREWVNKNVLKKIARQLHASALENRVADTSLNNNLAASREEMTKTTYSAAEEKLLQVQAGKSGKTVDELKRAQRRSAMEHYNALQLTPRAVLAGPTHSQISKDHVNSPFFGLSVRLASAAVARLEEKMVAAWAAEKGQTTPFNFEWGDWPRPGVEGVEARNVYHQGRPERNKQEIESLERTKKVIALGNDTAEPYNLAQQRREAAEDVNAAADVLQAAGQSPDKAAQAIKRVSKLLGNISPERLKVASEFLATLAGTVKTKGNQWEHAVMLKDTARDLRLAAAAIETTTQHDDRELLNAQLVQLRADAAKAMVAGRVDTSTAAITLIILDRAIVSTAVSYSKLQRSALEATPGPSDPLPEHIGPDKLKVKNLVLPNAASDFAGEKRSPARMALINEARHLFTHPYESTWWHDIVREHVKAHAAQIKADIEARNEGYAVFRRRGEQAEEGH